MRCCHVGLAVLALTSCHALLPLSPGPGEDGSTDTSRVDGWADQSSSPDTSADTGATPDGPCTWTTFSAPVEITELSSPYIDWAPHLADQGLTIYFSSDRFPSEGNTDIGVATRASTTAPFDAPSSLTTLNSDAPDSDPCVSGDGLEIFYLRGADIYRATRAEKDDAFSASTLVAGLAPGGEAVAAGPFLTRDGLGLYYHLCTTNNDPNTCDLALATRTAPGAAFTFVRKLGEVNNPSYTDGWPTVSADGLELFFEAVRPGTSPSIFRATRASTSAPFGSVVQVSELGVAGDPDLSADGRTLVFSATGPDDSMAIFMAARTCVP